MNTSIFMHNDYNDDENFTIIVDKTKTVAKFGSFN